MSPLWRRTKSAVHTDMQEEPGWPVLRDGHGLTSYVMSNFDHEIDRALEAKLRAGGTVSQYAGWNFHGVVWFADDEFHCEVSSHGVHRVTVHAATLEEIMEAVCGMFGAD